MSNEKQSSTETSGMLGSLRSSLLGAGALALLGLVLGGYAITNYLGQVAFHYSEIEHLKQLRTDVNLRQRQLTESTELLPDFELLQEQGVIGALAKTLEADRFEQLVADHPANVLSFAMGAVDPIAAPSDLMFSTLSLGRHELSFTAEPRHEVHLLRLLDQLPSALGGLSLLRSCDITRSIGVRTGARATEEANGINTQGDIRARCAIDWYVFGPSAVTPLAGSIAMQGGDADFSGAAP